MATNSDGTINTSGAAPELTTDASVQANAKGITFMHGTAAYKAASLASAQPDVQGQPNDKQVNSGLGGPQGGEPVPVNQYPAG